MIDRPRLALLRQRTRASHASIERVPGMALLVAPDLTLPHYVSVLQHMHAFLSAAEHAIAAALDGRCFWDDLGRGAGRGGRG